MKPKKQSEKLGRYWVCLPTAVGERIRKKCEQNYQPISLYLRNIILEHESPENGKHRSCDKFFEE